MKNCVTKTILFLLIEAVHAFYLPGLAPTTYCRRTVDNCKSTIPVMVNRLDSPKSVLPFDYKRFPFCAPKDVSAPAENLGEVLFGDRIGAGPLILEYSKDVHCQTLCNQTVIFGAKEKATARKATLLKRAIQLMYQQHWIVDNLPVVFCYNLQMPNGEKLRHCDKGFPIGCYVNEEGKTFGFGYCNNPKFISKQTLYMYNHYKLEVVYHGISKDAMVNNIPKDAIDPGRIISINIELESVQQKYDKDGHCTHGETPPQSFPASPEKELTVTIPFSYEVTWRMNSTITWSSRWDYILDSLKQPNIKWYSIINSLVIVLFMSGMIGMILLRTLHRDIARYNQESLEEAQEEFGWKLVHGDVFRPPGKGMMLSVFLGNGAQIFIMCIITLLFACLGFLSPANRGLLMTCAMVLYVLMGSPAGYTAARIYKMFGGEKWKSNVLLTAFFVPGLIFGVFFLLNLILWAKGSSAAVPFGTLVAVLALWFCVSVPLTFIGAYFGFKRTPIENPVRTNQIPRQVPDQTFYTRPVPSVLLGAVLPFGTIFIQLFFIFNSIWAHQSYYMFGFILLVFIILIITCSETAILLCYFHLCAEDYNWWWRSFFTTGFTAVYMFCFCIHYYVSRMEAGGATSAVLYFGYSLMMVFLFFLLTGTIGFFSCFWFVRKIYSVVKVD